MANSTNLILIIVTILFPPAAVAMISGCSCDLLINILLTLLGYIPGHIHAFWLIYLKMRAEEQYGQGGYNYVGQGHYTAGPNYQGAPQQQEPYRDQAAYPQPAYQQPAAPQQHAEAAPPGYGAVSK